MNVSNEKRIKHFQITHHINTEIHLKKFSKDKAGVNYIRLFVELGFLQFIVSSVGTKHNREIPIDAV